MGIISTEVLFLSEQGCGKSKKRARDLGISSVQDRRDVSGQVVRDVRSGPRVCRKSLKVHFEGRTGICTGDAGAAEMLRGEGSCSWSSFCRSWSSQGGRKGSREFHSDEDTAGDSSAAWRGVSELPRAPQPTQDGHEC